MHARVGQQVGRGRRLVGQHDLFNASAGQAALRQQRSREPCADESGTAGNENFHSRVLVVLEVGSTPPRSRRRALAAIDAAAAAGHDGVAEDLAFHRAVGEATGNPQFSQLLGFLEQYLRDGISITRGNEARRADFIEASRKEHRGIFEAIAARDAGAARRAATKHLVHSARRLERGGVLPAAKSTRTRE